MEEVKLYCRKCHRSYKVGYKVLGIPTHLIMDGIEFKCHTCSHEALISGLTESKLLKMVRVRNVAFI